jgi:molybdenum cofactor cytidylyltransferase
VKQKHLAIVLAAGGSARLGRPKQLLTREGETLVHRAARLASETSPERLLVVVGAERDDIARSLHDMPCELIDNPEWREGLGTSLRAAGQAIAAGPEAPVLVLGCDQPALELRHLQALLAGAQTAASRCAATAHGDRFGIPAVVPCDWLADADELTGDRGFGARLSVLATGSICALQAPELGLDIDTLDDLREAISLKWLDAVVE